VRIQSPGKILGILTAINFVNYVDRYLVAAVAPKFQEELGLSNTQTGFAISAFMLGYFVTSPIFGWLGDKRFPKRGGGTTTARRWLMTVGILLWCLATVASGLAHGATSMVLARVAVGVGEASYATLAPTIIDDLAPPSKKNRWLAIFYLAIPVGSALGFLLGGQLEEHFGWRAAFFVAGGPGALLAFIVPFMVEPAPHQAKDAEPAAQHVEQAAEKPEEKAITGWAAFGALRRSALYVGCVAGLCAYTFALGGFPAWAPKFLYESHGMKLSTADFFFGVVTVVAGIAGTVLGAWLADRALPPHCDQDTRVRRYLRFSGVATAIAVPAAALALYTPSAAAFFVAIFVCEVALFASTSPINVVILNSIPPSVRASAMAVGIFMQHLLGDLISPPLIGKIADVTKSLRTGMWILPIAIAIAAAIWLVGVKAKGTGEAQAA
jgi:MFS family permease